MTDETLHVNVTDTEGMTHRVPALDGWRVMEIIRDNGLPIRAECGGSCACATCHVYVASTWVDKIPPASSEELDMLDTVRELKPAQSRLSCQILMRSDLDGLEVTLAPSDE